jgi:hypothetical protein
MVGEPASAGLIVIATGKDIDPSIHFSTGVAFDRAALKLP